MSIDTTISIRSHRVFAELLGFSSDSIYLFLLVIF